MNVIQNHWHNDRIDLTPEADYLCLLLGHNPLVGKLANYIRTRYDYELDIVSFILFYISIKVYIFDLLKLIKICNKHFLLLGCAEVIEFFVCQHLPVDTKLG